MEKVVAALSPRKSDAGTPGGKPASASKLRRTNSGIRLNAENLAALEAAMDAEAPEFDAALHPRVDKDDFPLRCAGRNGGLVLFVKVFQSLFP